MDVLELGLAEEDVELTLGKRKRIWPHAYRSLLCMAVSCFYKKPSLPIYQSLPTPEYRV